MSSGKMSLTAFTKPAFLRLQIIQNISRNVVSWTQHSVQWNAAAKNSLFSQFCGISKPIYNTNISLIPNSVSATPSCGMKVKGKPQLICKDCWYYEKNNRLYVFCDAHPRHKQMSKVAKRRRNTYLIAFASQGKQRDY